MKLKREPNILLLRQCLDCDPNKGTLTWAFRPRDHFSTDRAFKIWNAKYPGKPAFAKADQHGYRSGRVQFLDCVYNLKRHRVIFALCKGSFPTEIDHIDGVPGNDAILNLRPSDRVTNCRNMRAHKDRNPLLPKWVCRVGNRFKAQVSAGPGLRKHIGFFDTPAEAYEAALEAAKRAHGNFTRAS